MCCHAIYIKKRERGREKERSASERVARSLWMSYGCSLPSRIQAVMYDSSARARERPTSQVFSAFSLALSLRHDERPVNNGKDERTRGQMPLAARRARWKSVAAAAASCLPPLCFITNDTSGLRRSVYTAAAAAFISTACVCVIDTPHCPRSRGDASIAIAARERERERERVRALSLTDVARSRRGWTDI